MTALKDLKKFLEKPTEFGIVPFWFLNHYPEEKIIKPELSSKRRRIGKSVTLMLPAGFFKD